MKIPSPPKNVPSRTNRVTLFSLILTTKSNFVPTERPFSSRNNFYFEMSRINNMPVKTPTTKQYYGIIL